MNSQNPTHDVLVDVEAEVQSDLLGNSGTAPGRITSFHFKDGIDEFFCRSLRPRLTPALGRKQHAVLTFCDGGGEKLVHFGGVDWATNVVTLLRFDGGSRMRECHAGLS